MRDQVRDPDSQSAQPAEAFAQVRDFRVLRSGTFSRPGDLRGACRVRGPPPSSRARLREHRQGLEPRPSFLVPEASHPVIPDFSLCPSQ